MSCPDDIPTFPYPKPKEIERIELLSSEIIHAMTRVEVNERIREAASSLAKSYKEHTPSAQANYDDCLLLVSSALTEIGSAVPGQLGLLLVATSLPAAMEASHEVFP